MVLCLESKARLPWIKDEKGRSQYSGRNPFLGVREIDSYPYEATKVFRGLETFLMFGFGCHSVCSSYCILYT